MKVNREELLKIINESAVDADLNYLDVTSVTNMSFSIFNTSF
jgi:hypothetical protein